MNLVTAFDISSACTGYAVLKDDGSLADHGAIVSDKKASIGSNLDTFRSRIESILVASNPAFIAIERNPWCKFAFAMDRLGMFRGVFYMIAGGQLGRSVNEVAQNSRLVAVGLKGGGRRKKGEPKRDIKAEVVAAVNRLYGLKLLKKENDVADAIAVGRAIWLEYTNQEVEDKAGIIVKHPSELNIDVRKQRSKT